MGLSEVFAEIEAKLVSTEAYVTTLLEGDEYDDENDATARYIVVPDSDEFDTVISPGGLLRALKTRIARVAIIIRGEDRATVEGMLEQFAVALHLAIKGDDANKSRGGTYELEPGKWTRGTRHAKWGHEWRGAFSVLMPIVERKGVALGVPPAPPTADTTTMPLAPADTAAGSTVSAMLGYPPTPQGTVTISNVTPAEPDEEP